MSGELPDLSFDLQAAWLRRFQADAEANLRAFALRLREALPDQVTIREHKGLFARTGTVHGLVVAMDQSHFVLELVRGRLQASIAMVVRGITINTKQVDPADWFAKLAAETKKSTEQAKALAQSLSAFMSS